RPGLPPLPAGPEPPTLGAPRPGKGSMMTQSRARLGVRAGAAALVLAAVLAWAPAAFAHAAISPPVAKTGVLQQFTLAVPTEKENATTTRIELIVPDGVAIDSFEPEPGWTRTQVAHGGG